MPTYRYVQNQEKLMMQIEKIAENLNLGNFFDYFEVKYLQIENFSEK